MSAPELVTLAAFRPFLKLLQILLELGLGVPPTMRLLLRLFTPTITAGYVLEGLTFGGRCGLGCPCSNNG